ncbi:hypothetical protein EU811_00900 [Arthrobacter sp. TS-15]|uniref:hypothetical protein n=1 Tax=Arthrobacter sp. TS-15 TaxID=2510797 RepID=UPI00115EDA2F|nr:hypothetical protein [Arthrobacter sp. TS-15]TQS94378.1 hypothetical protein EU811_00900 [Arthrobacter sp. TS-15]
MTELWIALALAVVASAGGLLTLTLRRHRSVRRDDAAKTARATETSASETMAPVRVLPASGILVPEAVLSTTGAAVSVWEALEVASVPMAFEYHPITDIELTKYKSVPVNAALHQALTNIVRAVDPKSATLFKAVLPKGAELVRAVGTSGFRGFARGPANISSQAVLYPVGIGGAAVAGWPILAVSASVMAMDMLAQREQRAHQRRVETILGRQEKRSVDKRISFQRTTDKQLSAAISLMLDGQLPDLDVARHRAGDDFEEADIFLEQTWSTIQSLLESDRASGPVDYRKLEEALGGKTKDLDHFARELHFARAAVALGRKALLADAAKAALADPSNQYLAFQKSLERHAADVKHAESIEAQVTEALTTLELTGRWHEAKKSIAGRQTAFRERFTHPQIDPPGTVQYLALPSGEIHQLVPVDTPFDEQAEAQQTNGVSP